MDKSELKSALAPPTSEHFLASDGLGLQTTVLGSHSCFIRDRRGRGRTRNGAARLGLGEAVRRPYFGYSRFRIPLKKEKSVYLTPIHIITALLEVKQSL